MVFSSALFVFLYLPLVLLAYYCVGPRWKNATLLAFSLLYFTWGEGDYALILALPIFLNWGAGLALDRRGDPRARKFILTGATVLNLGVLFHFKYTNFLLAYLNAFLETHGHGIAPIPNEPIHLVLGISFFTFHGLSYIIDVYRRVVRAQGNLVSFALYISFFPQLVAGPIVRYHDISDQLTDRRETLDKFASGVERFILGLGKKMLIANPLGATADHIFALSAAELSMPAAWLGILSYAFQIYFDFSGYSDMAIGLARMFGFEFLENFNYPYISRSMREFWRRWHISLSNWFRDYLYIPLGGNRGGRWRTYLNLLIVFVLCGLWHGASWHFLIWGLIHGGFLALERGPMGELVDRLPQPVRHCYVLLVVLVAWVFFRAHSMSAAVAFLAAMFGGQLDGSTPHLLQTLLDRQTVILLALAAVGSTPILSILARDWRDRRSQVQGRIRAGSPALVRMPDAIERIMVPLRPVLLASIFILSAAYLVGQTYNPFIYFRF